MTTAPPGGFVPRQKGDSNMKYFYTYSAYNHRLLGSGSFYPPEDKTAAIKTANCPERIGYDYIGAYTSQFNKNLKESTLTVYVNDIVPESNEHFRYEEITEEEAFRGAGKDDVHTVPMLVSGYPYKSIIFMHPQRAKNILGEQNFAKALDKGYASSEEWN